MIRSSTSVRRRHGRQRPAPPPSNRRSATCALPLSSVEQPKARAALVRSTSSDVFPSAPGAPLDLGLPLRKAEARPLQHRRRGRYRPRTAHGRVRQMTIPRSPRWAARCSRDFRKAARSEHARRVGDLHAGPRVAIADAAQRGGEGDVERPDVGRGMAASSLGCLVQVEARPPRRCVTHVGRWASHGVVGRRTTRLQGPGLAIEPPRPRSPGQGGSSDLPRGRPGSPVSGRSVHDCEKRSTPSDQHHNCQSIYRGHAVHYEPGPHTLRSTLRSKSGPKTHSSPCLSRGSVVGEGGLEPPRGFPHWHLKPARLPFRHSPE